MKSPRRVDQSENQFFSPLSPIKPISHGFYDQHSDRQMLDSFHTVIPLQTSIIQNQKRRIFEQDDSISKQITPDIKPFVQLSTSDKELQQILLRSLSRQGSILVKRDILLAYEVQSVELRNIKIKVNVQNICAQSIKQADFSFFHDQTIECSPKEISLKELSCNKTISFIVTMKIIQIPFTFVSVSLEIDRSRYYQTIITTNILQFLKPIDKITETLCYTNHITVKSIPLSFKNKEQFEVFGKQIILTCKQQGNSQVIQVEGEVEQINTQILNTINYLINHQQL